MSSSAVPIHQILTSENISSELKLKDTSKLLEEEIFLKSAIKQSGGQISRKMAKAIFLGPPESGKSCLILRLINKYPEKYSPSTGLIKSAVNVDVEVLSGDIASHHAITIDHQVGEWAETDIDLSLLAQMGKANTNPTSSSLNCSTPSKTTTSLKKVSAEKSDQNTSSLPTTDAMRVTSVTTSSKRHSLQLNKVSRVIEKYGFQKVKKYLKNSFSVYLIDSGGQVEFQEILPLFISGSCIYFFVFRLDQDWTSTFKVSYRTTDQQRINTYESSSTLEETFMQTLRSIDAIGEENFSNLQTHPPLVFIVGTHMDLLPSSSVEQTMTDLNKYIIALVDRHGFTNLVQYADWSSKKVFFTVDNYSPTYEGFKNISRHVNELVVRDDNFTIDYPVNYLLANLEICNIQSTLMTYEECEAIALTYEIHKGQVKHFLNFLNSRLGIVKYFPIKGLENLIVRNTQVLFDVITELIVKTFSSHSLLTTELYEFEKKGIITANVLKKTIESFEGIEANQILDMLVHLRIASVIKSHIDDEKKYFLPCVLSRIPHSSSPEQESPVSPIYVAFKSKHCPKGLLSVLINTLCDNTSEWSIIPDQIYRNQISFSVGKYHDRVTLMISISALKISVHPGYFKNILKRMTSFCKAICRTIDICMRSSIETLRYKNSKIQYFFGCSCDFCSCVHEAITDEDNEIIAHCDTTKQFYNVKKSARYWLTCSST